MLGRTDSRLRMVAILLAFAVISVAASARLGYWQVVASAELTARIDAVKSRAAEDAQKVTRGDIVDRGGKVLAKTATVDQLVAFPDTIEADELETSVDLLDVLLDLSNRQRLRYMETLSQGVEDGTNWLELERSLEFEQSKRLRDVFDEGLLSGFGLVPKAVRHYPRQGGEPGTSLASHLLGFVRADGRGGEGVERYYDERLSTVDPSVVDMATTGGASIRLRGLEPEPLRLTVDAKLQRAMEKDLYAIQTANKAKSVSAMIMDPESGAILAAASVPAYDAEDYAAIADDDISRLRNPLFQDAYEPGSVMKIFTATAALDLGLVTPNTIIQDQKKLKFWTDTVQNADHKSLGALRVKDVIAKSRNVATAKIAKRLAPNSTQKAGRRLYALWDKVGMARRTGVDVPGEATGTWYDPAEKGWAPVDLANRAFGQGMATTLPQLARGFSTIVNGGFVVQPHVVVDGENAEVEPERTLKAKTANQAKDILRQVTGAVWWYAQGTLIPGYDIGGKTGTAQIWDSKRGKWKDRRFNHSFVGFIGGRKQEYVIAVRLEEPVPMQFSQGSLPLRIESYEAFQIIARTTIDQLKMKKSKDPLAGKPIPGTEAAKRLAPTWNRQQVRIDKNRRSSSGKQSTKKQTNTSKVSRQGASADPPASAGQGT